MFGAHLHYSVEFGRRGGQGWSDGTLWVLAWPGTHASLLRVFCRVSEENRARLSQMSPTTFKYATPAPQKVAFAAASKRQTWPSDCDTKPNGQVRSNVSTHTSCLTDIVPSLPSLAASLSLSCCETAFLKTCFGKDETTRSKVSPYSGFKGSPA